MKQAIKNILGAKNARRLAKIRNTARISTNRFFRTIFSGKECLPALQTRTFHLPDAHVFFGYYDVSQFTRDEKLLLAMAAPLINTTPLPDDHLRIGFFDLREERPEFREFGLTGNWCWQQGCRLQWYPFEGESTVLYNTLVEGRYGCVIQEVPSGKLVTFLPRPIYTVSRNGKWGLSIDFSRLQRLRPGYGYNTLPDISAGETAPFGDGIWRINMETGEDKLLFSVRDIATLGQDVWGADAQHYFNHLLFNIEGDRFMFFHICQLSDGKRKIRLFTSGVDGKDIRLLNGSGHASHYSWRDNDHLLCYSTVSAKGEGYYLFNDSSGETQIVGAGVLTEDGHPSYFPGESAIITDTYPDKHGESSLLLYDCEINHLTVLNKEFMPMKFHSETRCDFHPRVSPSGKQICIDCIITGKRAMKLFDVAHLIGKA